MKEDIILKLFLESINNHYVIKKNGYKLKFEEGFEYVIKGGFEAAFEIQQYIINDFVPFSINKNIYISKELIRSILTNELKEKPNKLRPQFELLKQLEEVLSELKMENQDWTYKNIGLKFYTKGFIRSKQKSNYKQIVWNKIQRNKTKLFDILKYRSRELSWPNVREFDFFQKYLMEKLAL